MTENIKLLIEKAMKIRMSSEDREAQRRSFAYGNANIENNRVTREMIDAAANRTASKQ